MILSARTTLVSAAAAAGLLGFASPALPVENFDQLGNLAQAEFKLLSEDLSSSLSYKALVPTEPLGWAGFDIGLEMTVTDLQNPDLFDDASSNSVPSALVMPKIHFHKGLPGRVDLGVFVGKIPATSIELTGFEVRYALVEGGAIAPAVGLSATYTTLAGIDQLDVVSRGLELSISKDLAVATPYGGIGRVETDSKPDPSTGLSDEEIKQTKIYVGVKLKFGLTLEADKTGDAQTSSIKFGWRF